jgi:hypothetical protein
MEDNNRYFKIETPKDIGYIDIIKVIDQLVEKKGVLATFKVINSIFTSHKECNNNEVTHKQHGILLIHTNKNYLNELLTIIKSEISKYYSCEQESFIEKKFNIYSTLILFDIYKLRNKDISYIIKKSQSAISVYLSNKKEYNSIDYKTIREAIEQRIKKLNEKYMK